MIFRDKKDARKFGAYPLHWSKALPRCLICDEHWHIEYANAKFVQLTGFELRQIKGKHPKDISDPGISREENEHLWENIQLQVQRRRMAGEMHNTRKTGKILGNKLLFPDAGGKYPQSISNRRRRHQYS